MCLRHPACTAIDYGKIEPQYVHENYLADKCYLNYGGKTTYEPTNRYDAYTIQRKGGMKNRN